MQHFNKLKIDSSKHKIFGDGGLLYEDKRYFTIFHKSDLSYCWIFVADDFSKYLHIRGKCHFELLMGNLKINGVDFMAPFYCDIYSPMSHSNVTLQVGHNTKLCSGKLLECIQYLSTLKRFSAKESQLLRSLIKIMEQLIEGNSWVVLRIATLHCIVSDDIEQFIEFHNIYEVDKSFPFAKKVKFSVTNEQQPSFCITKEIEICIDEIMRNLSVNNTISVVLVGAKDAGKSSLMKTIINRFFSERCSCVFVIDGDPGQSEFFPGGFLTLTLVSRPLFGPPFTHQFQSHIKVLKRIFLGALSPFKHPERYCCIFKRLYQSYLDISKNNRSPLVINTMGWPDGLGLSLLAFKLFVVNPSYILQLKKGQPKKDYSDINNEFLQKISQNVNLLQNVRRNLDSKFYIVKSANVNLQNKHIMKLKPDKHRDLTMLAYLFFQTINIPLCFTEECLPSKYYDDPVTRLRCRMPVFLKYECSINNNCNNGHGNLPRVRLLSSVDNCNAATNIAELFSMSLVAICRAAIGQELSLVEIDQMECIGLGMVSHVRPEDNEIDVLTGVDVSMLNGCYLVKGDVELPSCL